MHLKHLLTTAEGYEEERILAFLRGALDWPAPKAELEGSAAELV